MKPNLGDRERLLHSIDAIAEIDMYLQGFDLPSFRLSSLHRSATERQLEIIGEAASRISQELKDNYPLVDWQPVKRFRNVIVHEYFGVSVQIVWGVVQKELPVLKQQVLSIVDALGAGDRETKPGI